MGNWGSANKVEETSPERKQATEHFKRGISLTSNQDHEEARAEFDKAIEIDPSFAPPRF